MKRLKFVLAIMFLVALWTGALLGQQPQSKPVDNHTDLMQKRMEMRAEMHRRMMDKLINGVGTDQDMFQDMENFLQDVMTENYDNLNRFNQPRDENFKMEWSESTSGKTLSITPKTPEQKLDINVAKELITIKGNVETKTPNGTTSSSFSQTFNIPSECDSSKVKMDQKDRKILVHFPFKEPLQKKLKPLPPSKEDVQI